jgi:hypothetical protein
MMLHKLLSVIAYCIFRYSSLSTAEALTIEKTLDLTVFGTCNIYLKRFCDDQVAVDLTERLILVEQKYRRNYALTTIENATRLSPVIGPTISLLENCVLNVIVGIAPSDDDRLVTFLYESNYTY